MARLSSLGAAADGVGAWLDALLATYAQVLFSRSRLVGALLLAATAFEPAALVQGLIAVAVARLGARWLGVRADGPHAYNALLVGLGVAHLGAPWGASLALVVVAALVVVLVSTSLESLLARVSLPVLSVPFVLVHWTLTGLAPVILNVPAGKGLEIHGPLEALGALFFLPRVDAGVLVLAALLVHSRIATLLAALACGGVLALVALVPALAPSEGGFILNAALTAVAVGGVWFVPSASSFGLAMFGALTAVSFALGLGAPLARAGLPLLILPFNAAVAMVLLAARQRTFDRRPKAVDFVPGSPEENLAHFQTRLARFRALYAVTFRLPFRGAWTCTQGVDGAHTHQDAWRYAFDFEVRGEDGLMFAAGGARPEDHHCFKLPVLAAADGVVAKVVDGVVDNDVGDMDVANNWGNAVVVYHGTGLYSLVAHLAKGSVCVREGQPVRRGEVLGSCGSSGRSPRPHLHFQLQTTPQLGAPTLPCRFSDLVLVRDAEELTLATTPRVDETVRNLEAEEELAAFFALEVGAVLELRAEGETEHLEHEVDLLGSLVLRSREHGATLAFARTEDGFTAFDALGPGRSVLHAVRAALPRVPFDAAALEWTDYLPARWSGGSVLGPLRDFIAPFAPQAGLEMKYRALRKGDALVVSGQSTRRRRGEPLVRTRATLRRGRGLVALEVHTGGTHLTYERGDAANEAFERARAASPSPSASRRKVMTMKRIQWVGVALFIAAGCARGHIEKDPSELVTVETTAAPVATNVSLAAAETTSAAFQKSYNDEAAGDSDAALAALAGVTATGNAQYVVELRRGWLLYKLGKNAEAAAAYGRASALEPNAIEPRVGALPPLGALRRWADVESMAREVQKKDPGNYTASLRLAFALYSQAKYVEAEAAYRTLLTLYPSDVEVRAGLGWSLVKENKLTDAQVAFAEVLAVAPKNALALEGAAAARR